MVRHRDTWKCGYCGRLDCGGRCPGALTARREANKRLLAAREAREREGSRGSDLGARAARDPKIVEDLFR